MSKRIILALIKIYQKTISPDHGSIPLTVNGIFSFGLKAQICRFHPTCSEYAYEAVEKFGAKKGLVLAIKRLSRCHPFNAGGYDPVKDI